MNELETDTLASDDFVLDDCTLHSYLQHWSQYVQRLPFDDPFMAQVAPEQSWQKFFFPGEGDANARLTQLLEAVARADGQLPPQQVFLIAFLGLFRIPQALFNSLPARHRLLYYRDELGLRPQPAVPDRVVLSFVSDEDHPELLLPAGLLFDAGQDSTGSPLHYGLEQSLLVNRATLTDLRWYQPSQSDRPAVTRIALDTAAQPTITWPHAGMRLFAYAAGQDRPVVSARVVASPVLATSGGRREITVIFTQPVNDVSRITAWVSGEDRWLLLDNTSELEKTDIASFTLSADQPAIVASPGLDGFTDTVPLLKFIYKDGQAVPAVASIKVKVSNSPCLLYATEDGPSAANKRSRPFGAEPVIGSSFHMASPDWCEKPDCAMTLTLEPVWSGLPNGLSFKQWYDKYDCYGGIVPDNDNVFKLSCTLIGDSRSLFKSNDKKSTGPSGESFTFEIKLTSTLAGSTPDPRDWPGSLRFQLDGQDFMHQVYWAYMGAPKHEDNDEKKSVIALAHPPYTPQVQSWSVTWTLSSTSVATQYRLTPFGHVADASSSQSLPTDRELYLGFVGIQPGQELTLHWQLRSPGAQQALSWFYLAKGGVWRALNAQVQDDTGQLFFSGLWRTTLPLDAIDKDPAMPAGRYWIRASFGSEGNSDDAAGVSDFPWLYGIHVGCTSAVLIDVEQVAPDHLTRPLPAGTITRTVEPLNGLQIIEQPWPSEGGRAAETSREWYARAAQRMNHRDRALTWRDICSLLKTRFPQIYDARPVCNLTNDAQQLVVVPIPGQSDSRDALRPAFNTARLHVMQNFIRDRASPWLSLTINNPTYRAVRVTYELKLTLGVNKDYGYRQVARALHARYMPWADAAQAGALPIGASIDYYEMLAFIEQLEEVKAVESLLLNGAQESIVARSLEVLTLEVYTPNKVDTLGIL